MRSLGAGLGGYGPAKPAPSARFTSGLRVSSILSALLNATALMLLTGGLSCEAMRRMSNPAPVEGSVVIWFALVGVAVNGVTAWLFMQGGKKDMNLRGVYLHMAGVAGRRRGRVRRFLHGMVLARACTDSGSFSFDPMELLGFAASVARPGAVSDSRGQ